MKIVKMNSAFLWILLFCGLIVCGAAVTQKSTYQTKAEKFLTDVYEGNIDKAYDEILPKWLKEGKPAEMEILKKQTNANILIHGKLLGYEFIKQQKYGESVIRLVYVLKSERMPLTWEFYFYKPVSNWELVNILFNDQFDILADK